MSSQPKLNLIRTAQGINELRDYIKDFEYVAYDCETTGLSKESEIIGFSICCEEEQAFYVILTEWDKETQKLRPNDIRADAQRLIADLIGYKLVMHNAIFDCKMAEAFFGVSLINSLHTDTMVLAHLLDENRRVGLKELAKTLFGADSTKEQQAMKDSVLNNGGKLTRAEYEMYKADADLMGFYGAQDTILTYRLFWRLLPDLVDQGLYDFFYEDESMPLLKGPTYQLNETGLQVDMKALTTLKKTLETECAEAKDYIYTEIKKHIEEKYPGTTKKNEFNVGSNQQLAWLLFGQLGLEFGTLTDEGKIVCQHLVGRLPYHAAARRDFIAACQQRVGEIYKPEATINGKKVRAKKVKEPWAYTAVDKKVLAKHADRHRWVAKLLEYNKKQKILNTYVLGIESRTQYGVISPSFLQTGTTSGRYSSRDPNFQNLPRDDKRVKACIVARPGKVFVGADYSQLEPRVFAYFSGDERLLAAFKGTDDFYSVIGMEVYGKTDCTPHKDGSPDAFGVKYKKLRDLSKVIALASTYGATANQLASTTGKSIEDTQLDIDNYFEAFPGVAQMMLDSHALAKKDGQVVNLFGRPRRMPEAKNIGKLYGQVAHANLPYEARNLLNLSVNHRIQSTGASIVNRAAIKFYNDCNDLDIKAKIVVQVHDSLVIECDEANAEIVAVLLENAMTTAVQLKGIDLEAIPQIGKNLAEV